MPTWVVVRALIMQTRNQNSDQLRCHSEEQTQRPLVNEARPRSHGTLTEAITVISVKDIQIIFTDFTAYAMGSRC